MYYTIVWKNVTCPKWNVAVSIKGKYRVSEDPNDKGHFLSSKCPIIENSKLPVSQQCAEYKLMRCQNPDNCNYLHGFASCVDIVTGQSV